MIRMEQQDKMKELVNKVYKLKRQKRELLDKYNKAMEKGTRWASVKQAGSAAHLSKVKGERKGKGTGARHHLHSTKHSERATGEAKLKASRSHLSGAKKAYDTVQNNPSSNGLLVQEHRGSIAREATQ